MAGIVEKKLAELGISLPQPKAPVANYVPFVRTGNFMLVSGQICFGDDGKLVAKGKLGGPVSVENGQKAARACAVNLLAQLKAAIGDLDKVVRVMPDLYYARAAADESVALVRTHCRAHGEITAATFRDLIGASRKFAIAFLDWCDRTGVTVNGFPAAGAVGLWKGWKRKQPAAAVPETPSPEPR